MTVKVFRSTDFGAPANTNAAGALIAILDACLVNGYGAQTVTSITRTDTTATVTTPSAHLLKDGTFMRISGAGQSDYNGDFAITVTGANTFTYPVANSPVTPATGTITSKVAPVDWTKPFTGTNIAAFKQGAGSNGMYLRISDTTTAAARVKAFEAMTDVNTGTGDFPTDAQVAGGLYMLKSSGSTPTKWIMVADEKILYLITGQGTSTATLHIFGDIISKKLGDSFGTVISFPTATNSDITAASLASNLSTAQGGKYTARIHTQLGSSVQALTISPSLGQSSMGYGGTNTVFPYPNPIDGALHMSEIYWGDVAIGYRGKMPGLYNLMHAAPFQDMDTVKGTGVNSNRKFIAVNLYSSLYQAFIEISNTWYV